MNKLFKSHYSSPIGKIILVGDNKNIVALNFEGQKYFLNKIPLDIEPLEDLEIFLKAKNWLNSYFSKKNPSIEKIPISPIGTDFQKMVWEELLKIPYGKTICYSDIAKIIAKKKNIKKMSSQAIAGAIAKNPILIIIPCHRVLAKNGNLAGFSAGIDKKIKLLEIEDIYNKDMTLNN